MYMVTLLAMGVDVEYHSSLTLIDILHSILVYELDP